MVFNFLDCNPKYIHIYYEHRLECCTLLLLLLLLIQFVTIQPFHFAPLTPFIFTIVLLYNQNVITKPKFDDNKTIYKTIYNKLLVVLTIERDMFQAWKFFETNHRIKFPVQP